MKAVFRRALWGVVMLGWPAMVAVRLAFHPEWGGDLAMIGAPAEGGCALLLRAGQAITARGRRRDRETERRLGELETVVGGMGDALAAAFRYAGAPRPEPLRLRLVRTEGSGERPLRGLAVAPAEHRLREGDHGVARLDREALVVEDLP